MTPLPETRVQVAHSAHVTRQQRREEFAQRRFWRVWFPLMCAGVAIVWVAAAHTLTINGAGIFGMFFVIGTIGVALYDLQHVEQMRK